MIKLISKPLWDCFYSLLSTFKLWNDLTKWVSVFWLQTTTPKKLRGLCVLCIAYDVVKEQVFVWFVTCCFLQGKRPKWLAIKQPLLSSKKNKIIDPMFKVFDADMTCYLKELSKHVEQRPDLRYFLVDIQKLKEAHRVDNRSEWNEYDPILLGCYWFDIQTQKVDEAW